jgi:hypothetical protein
MLVAAPALVASPSFAKKPLCVKVLNPWRFTVKDAGLYVKKAGASWSAGRL